MKQIIVHSTGDAMQDLYDLYDDLTRRHPPSMEQIVHRVDVILSLFNKQYEKIEQVLEHTHQAKQGLQKICSQ